MNIFYLNGPDGGSTKWRAEVPAKYLRRLGHTVQFHGSASPTAPDAIVFSRSYFVEVERLYLWCKQKRIRVVYDVDDAMDLVPRHNAAYLAARKLYGRAEFMLCNADVVTTTTELLAAHLRHWNPNVVVIPNSVDPEEWHIRPRSAGHPLRIGWSGGGTHFLDLALALDALIQLQKEAEFTFVIHGLVEEPSVAECYSGATKEFKRSPVGRAMKSFLDRSSRLRYEFHPFVPIGSHTHALCSLALDVGIAPLRDTAFNRHKSCIKFYEYAMSGAATLASNVLPYSGEVPATCENTRDAWREKLAAMLGADLRSLWAEQYAWVMEHRNIQRNVQLWQEVFAGGDPEPMIPEAHAGGASRGTEWNPATP